MSVLRIPCARCGEPVDYHLHAPASACAGCLAPQDHHSYRPAAESAAAAAVDLLRVLERIAGYEVRADRRKRGMVDVSVVDDLRRIARAAIRLHSVEEST